MNRSLIIKGLIAILIVFIFGLSIVGCIDTGDNNINDGGGDNTVTVDKTALNAELALEVTEQGDYTADSYNAYLELLNAAKALAGDENATQESIDKATEDLSAARLALVVKPIFEVEGGKKSFTLVQGDSEEIAIADYIDENGLSKITYKVKTSNAVVDISDIVDGKFTFTAGAVNKVTDLTVSIVAYYDGVEKLKVDLAVKISNEVAPTLVSEEVVREYDKVALGSEDNIFIDFAENVINPGNIDLTYTIMYKGTELEGLDGPECIFVLGNYPYTEEYSYESFEVIVSCVVNGVEKTLEYTYKLGIKDTGKYNVVNGNFENGLYGWTLTNTYGEAPFGGIDGKTHFWPDAQNFPMNNIGSYFSAYADGASEGSQGTLASSYFTVNSEYATYMLGGAGNHNVYITIENKDGQVLALYRNTMFADIPSPDMSFEEQNQLLGVTIFLANFVTYKVDLSAWRGMEVRFVVHDYASEGWGVVFFDELNTYYTSEDPIPEGAVDAVNLLADKAALNNELALEVTEQGDYTLDSYDAYLAKLSDAKALLNDVAVTQEVVDNALSALTSARLALTVRPVLEVKDANKSFRLTSGNTKEITLADYINENGLSGITYTATAGNLITLSAVADGKLTITAGQVSGVAVEAVTITVYYHGEEKLTVELSVEITNDIAPSVFNSEVNKGYDIFELENKTNITLDLSSNVDNAGGLALTYSVNGETISGSTYTFTFGSYNDKATYEVFEITVSYVANGEEQSVSYTYKLGMTDTTAYRLNNGGFENGIDGWTVVGNIGGVSSDRTYWNEGIDFGMDGDNMFSAYAPGALESAVGTLTSSNFVVGGSGFVTFKVGAMRDQNYVYVDVVDAETKQILARYYNGLWSDAELGGCKLVAYKADLSAFAGKEVLFRISDNADSGYGLFFADSFVTYYESEPEGFNDATHVEYQLPGTIYDVFNGGFEMGNVQGWWNIGEIGVVTNANGYWGDNIPYEKVGDFLFTGVESFGADTMREGNRGALTSSAFVVGGTGWISFKLGGGGSALCYVQVIDAVTGEVLARYHQQAQRDAILIQYVADLSAYIGRTVRIQVVDQADSGWGCVSFDNVVTYYPAGAELPEGITATDIKGDLKYTIDNGSFETGNIDGWTQNIWEAGGQNTLGWVLENEIDAGWYTKNTDRKDGKYLLTFATPEDVNCENTKGTLQSSTFTLKQGSFVSFRFGGAGTREVRIELCRADGSVIATFYNEAPGKVNTEMYAYFYQYADVTTECFFRVVDDSTSNYGCFVVDDFRVNLESAPEGFIAAIQ